MDFLDRIGQLNIPTGLQGTQGPAGSNGAGWSSGAGNPRSAPPADIKYYLNTTSGQIFEWNGSAWVSVVTTIKGTNGNVWFTGIVDPNTITVAGAVVNDFFLDTVLGNVYKLVGVNWVLQLTIKGTNGTNGTNGTPGARVPIRTYNPGTITVAGSAVGAILGDQGFTLSEFFPKIGDWIKLELDTLILRPGAVSASSIDGFSFDIAFSDNGTTNYSNLEPGYTETTLFNSLALSTNYFTCTSRVTPTPARTDFCTVNVIAKIYRTTNNAIAYTVSYTGGTTGDNIISKVFKNTMAFNFANTTGSFKINIYNVASNPIVSLRTSNTTVTIEKYEMPNP